MNNLYIKLTTGEELSFLVNEDNYTEHPTAVIIEQDNGRYFIPWSNISYLLLQKENTTTE